MLNTVTNGMLKLPAELHVEIFKAVCRPWWDTFHRTDWVTDMEHKYDLAIPFMLRAVCGHWRDIVMSSPVLWSNITIVLSTTTLDNIIALFETHLERSGECLLAIKLTFENDDDGWPQSIPDRLIQLFASSACRWRAIDMALPESWSSTLSKFGPVFRNLKAARVRPVDDDVTIEYAKSTPSGLFEHTAPVLQDLHMSGYYLRMVQAPWEQLTRLSIAEISINECFHVLEKTPNLACFMVHSIWERGENSEIHTRKGLPEEKPIPLPYLRTLIIANCDWPDIIFLISSLYLPSLKNLQLNSSGWQGSKYVYTYFPGEIRFALQDHRSISKVDLQEFLWSMPLLQSVDIDLPESKYSPQELPMQDFLNAYALSQPGHGYLLPNLEEFSFKGGITFKNETDICQLLVEALTARRTPSSSGQEQGKPLRSFILETDKELQPSIEVKQKLERLVADGLHIQIVCAGKSWL